MFGMRFIGGVFAYICRLFYEDFLINTAITGNTEP